MHENHVGWRGEDRSSPVPLPYMARYLTARKRIPEDLGQPQDGVHHLYEQPFVVGRSLFQPVGTDRHPSSVSLSWA